MTTLAKSANLYYDWQRTLTYDADITCVISSRGRGKTYGLRCQFIRDYLKDGSTFVEIARHANELPGVESGYFDRVSEQFPGYAFKVKGHIAKIAAIPPEGAKKLKDSDFSTIGYFVALSSSQSMKRHTFKNVRRLVLDEALIERRDRWHDYLPDEVGKLTSLVDSCTRERADDEYRRRPHVYLLGNAVDFVNPYFAWYKVNKVPGYGYHWYGNKMFLLHYVEPGEYEQQKATRTLAGRMAARNSAGAQNIENLFDERGSTMIAKKPPRAKFMYSVIFNGDTFSIWYDSSTGNLYAQQKLPKGERVTLALTKEDNDVNYVMADRTSRPFQYLLKMYRYGALYFDSYQTRAIVMDILSYFGVR